MILVLLKYQNNTTTKPLNQNKMKADNKNGWGFCETPDEKCTMNYCDENGCQNRKRFLIDPEPLNQNKMTAVEQLIDQLTSVGVLEIPQGSNAITYIIEQAKEMEKQHKTLLVEQLKDYTKEAQCILGNDDREASEFVEIFYKTTFKSE